MYTPTQLQQYLEWDELTWSKALMAWDEILATEPNPTPLLALELGGRNGGLSLYLAHKGIQTVCSDFGGPTATAKTLHHDNKVSDLVSYQDIDATKINYPDNHFDIVIFKSILGVVAANNKTENLEMVSKEIYRVLKPGGYLLFAENMKASCLHTLARRWFVPWGAAWHYLSTRELQAFIAPFKQHKIKYFGFVSAFIKIKKLKKTAYIIDTLKNNFLPNSFKYISYGWAKK